MNHALHSFVTDSKLLPISKCQVTLGDFSVDRTGIFLCKKVISVFRDTGNESLMLHTGGTPNYEGDGQTTKLTFASLIKILCSRGTKRFYEREQNSKSYKEFLLQKYRYYKDSFDETLNIDDFEKMVVSINT